MSEQQEPTEYELLMTAIEDLHALYLKCPPDSEPKTRINYLLNCLFEELERHFQQQGVLPKPDGAKAKKKGTKREWTPEQKEAARQRMIAMQERKRKEREEASGEGET